MISLTFLQLSDTIQVIIVEDGHLSHILICVESLFHGLRDLLLAPKA
jgi:hypothetical protein